MSLYHEIVNILENEGINEKKASDIANEIVSRVKHRMCKD